MSLLCPISVGELVDKLTILEIKLENIKDHNKIIEIQHEYDALINHIPNIQEKIGFQYQVLKLINADIWVMMDQIREIDAKTEPNRWIEACQKTIIDNDRRFRVKKQINRIMESDIKEQKGYAYKKALLIAPDIEEGLDLDEMIPFIKYLETLYDFIVIKNYIDPQIKDPICHKDPQLLYQNDANLNDFKQEDIYHMTTVSQRITHKNINDYVRLVHKYYGNHF